MHGAARLHSNECDCLLAGLTTFLHACYRLYQCHFAGFGYRYMSDLLSLESCISADQSTAIQGGMSPLCHTAWRTALQTHPDKVFVDYICKGLQVGFRIGFAGRIIIGFVRSKPLWDASSNMFSAMQHPKPISE